MTKWGAWFALALVAGCDGGSDADRRDGSVDPPPALDCEGAPTLIDTSAPTRVVGNGTSSSCTEAALREAVAAGGIVTFDCGGDHQITLTRTIDVTSDVVIDGGGRITLDGGDSVRILAIRTGAEVSTPHLTVQRLRFEDGRSSVGGDDRERGGGAIHRIGGRLTVIACEFVDNRGPSSGQDVAGGAIYGFGGGATVIADSTFTGNEASNGGAVGGLFTDLSIFNSALDGNRATGTGGNPGNGGNGGAIYLDGRNQATRICGARITNNRGNAFGGAVFRVSNDATGSFAIERSTVSHNVIEPSFEGGLGGGLYLQGLMVSIAASTIASNQAWGGGGLFFARSRIEITNATVAYNVASDSLGGGIVFSDDVTGTVLNVTLANNRAPDDDAFAAATVGGASVTFRNVLIAGHEAGNGYNPISCQRRHMSGGGNVQWPVMRSGGGSDEPDALCAEGVRIADPLLGAITGNGGPTETLLPMAGSPAIGAGTGCPASDQRGMPRSRDRCTSGAVEAN